jgi:hypothetical protein
LVLFLLWRLAINAIFLSADFAAEQQRLALSFLSALFFQLLNFSSAQTSFRSHLRKTVNLQMALASIASINT